MNPEEQYALAWCTGTLRETVIRLAGNAARWKRLAKTLWRDRVVLLAHIASLVKTNAVLEEEREDLRQQLAERVAWAGETRERIKQAHTIAERFGGIHELHHKQWVVDQMLRAMLGEEAYATWVDSMNADKEYEPWDIGIAP